MKGDFAEKEQKQIKRMNKRDFGLFWTSVTRLLKDLNVVSLFCFKCVISHLYSPICPLPAAHEVIRHLFSKVGSI